jgi:hypothetical protein
MMPEFSLLVECCRLAFAEGSGERASGLARTTDWPLFVRLARHHRVQGLVARSLVSLPGLVPGAVSEELKSDATEIAARNLRSAAESDRLAKAFAAANIPLLFVKGLTLGALAYGDLSVKAGIDIDLLVEPVDLARAAQVLIDGGWSPVVPTGGPERIVQWHRVRKESVWRQPEADLQADLHSRLADNPHLIPQISASSPSQTVSIAPVIALRTLAPEELFAYLAVHGASSAWFRLKWITDFAALLSEFSPAELELHYARSVMLGAGRAPAWALLLADRLYGTLGAAPELARSLSSDRANRRLVEFAIKLLERCAEPLEPTGRAFGTAPIHLSQLLLLPGPGFKLGEAWRQCRARFA